MQRAPSGTLHLFYGTIRQLGHHNLGVSMWKFLRQQGQHNRGVHRQMRTHVVVFHDNKDNIIGSFTAKCIPVRNWKSVKKRRKLPWKSVICRCLCPVYKQNIAIYIFTRTITEVHGRHNRDMHSHTVLFPLSMFAVKKRLHGDIVYSIC